MKPAERAGSLHFKPLHQRAFVAAAGPLANFILAIVIFTVAFMSSPSQPVEPPTISEISAGSAAKAAGLQVGDVIESIGGVAVVRFPDLQRLVSDSEGRELHLVILRDGEAIEIVQHLARPNSPTRRAADHGVSSRHRATLRTVAVSAGLYSCKRPDVVDHTARISALSRGGGWA